MCKKLICKCVCRQLWLCEVLTSYPSCACNCLHEWPTCWQQAAEMCLGTTSTPADSSASPPAAPNAAPDAERHGIYGASGDNIAHETHDSDARGNASSQSAFKRGAASAAATSACAAGSAAAGAFELNLSLGPQLIITSVHSSRMQARQPAGCPQIQSASMCSRVCPFLSNISASQSWSPILTSWIDCFAAAAVGSGKQKRSISPGYLAEEHVYILSSAASVPCASSKTFEGCVMQLKLEYCILLRNCEHEICQFSG